MTWEQSYVQVLPHNALLSPIQPHPTHMHYV